MKKNKPIKPLEKEIPSLKDDFKNQFKRKKETQQKAIEDNGGKVGSSISTKTDYVIAGENMGPAKLEKANQLKTPIISEIEFSKMINE